MRIRWTFCLALFSLGIALFAMPAAAQNADIETLRPLVNALGDGGFAETEKAISNLAATGDPRVAPVLEALRSGDLYVRKSDGMVVGGEREGREYAITDPLTSEALGKVGRREADKIRVNNSLRRIIDTAVGGLTLRAADPRVRSKAAAAIFQSQDTDAIALLEAAVADEQDAGVKRLMEQARAAAIMASDRSDAEKRSAIEVLIDRGDQETRSLLLAAAQNASDELKPELQRAVAVVENNLAAWSALQNVWYGLSLGSVLLLAAIGLAITFGVMGVINMAHGEMVMLGAYTTFVVQEIIRTNVPGLFDYSLAIAVPLAFLVAGAVGIAIERSVIRGL
jgi:urea transport system permease protein